MERCQLQVCMRTDEQGHVICATHKPCVAESAPRTYPGDKPSGTQWFPARKATLVTPRTIIYNIDTAGGQSGAPVWRFLNGQRHVVGIHTNGSQLGNSATRIVTAVFNNIKAWKAQGM
jgi:V8-like Glu-specific endopeptidase